MIRIGDATVSIERREAFVQGRPVHMGGRAFDILATLIRAGGRIVTKDELIETVWPDTVVEENNLQVQISHLRRVIGNRNLIQTVHRRGYRLLDPDSPIPTSMAAYSILHREPTSDNVDDMTRSPTFVYVIDDDQMVRTALGRLLDAEGISHLVFSSAEDFLAASLPDTPACLLLDVELPLATGLDLQAILNARGQPWPIIFMTGHGTIPMTVQAMRAGAVEFLTKPFEEEDLLGALSSVLEAASTQHAKWRRIHEIKRRVGKLTPRECEVMELIVTGLTNKMIASQLKMSEVTVKVHKKRIMEKMQAETVIELAGFHDCLNKDPR